VADSRLKCNFTQNIFYAEYLYLTQTSCLPLVGLVIMIPFDKVGILFYSLIMLVGFGIYIIPMRSEVYNTLVKLDKKFSLKRNLTLLSMLFPIIGVKIFRDKFLEYMFILLFCIMVVLLVTYHKDALSKYEKLLKFADDSWP